MEGVAKAEPVGDGIEERLSRGLILRKVVEALGHLNRADCAAFLFHLQPDVAEHLVLNLVPSGQTEVAIAQRAVGLQMRPAALEEAIEEIPWSDLKIAAFMGVRGESDHARQMYVINRRQRAMRLMRRMVERDDADQDALRGPKGDGNENGRR